MDLVDYPYLRSSVKSEIRRKSISQTLASEEMGVDSTTLSYFLSNNENRKPDTNNIVKMCRWLNLPIQRFVVGSDRALENYTGDTLEGIKSTIDGDDSLDKEAKSVLFSLMEFAYKREVINV